MGLASAKPLLAVIALTLAVIATPVVFFSRACKPVVEQYEPVSSDGFTVFMKVSGRVSWDDKGVPSGGPVDSLSIGGENLNGGIVRYDIDLTDGLIEGGFILTKKYGTIMVKAGPNFNASFLLTPTQKRKFKELVKYGREPDN